MHFVFWLLFAFLIRAQDGAGLDPHGKPAVRAAGDEGNGLDPHGGRVGGFAGVIIDPNGVTAQGGGDKGLGVDPNG